jgi:polyhydroxybutyrate depolymerase
MWGIACLCAGAAGADYSTGNHIDESLVHDGTPRFYDVDVPPSYTGSSAVALVVDIHGLTSNKTDQRSLISGFSGVSDTEGFIVAYPQGLHGDPADDEVRFPPAVPLEDVEGPSWNAGDHCCARAKAVATDDVGFIRAMVAAIRAEGNIDSRRIYVTGLSNGGALTQVLACEAADLFAAAAPVAFPGAFAPLTECTPSRPIAIISFQGVTDLLVPYLGGNLLGSPSQPVVESAQASFEFWRDENACAGASPDVSDDIGLSNSCDRYNQCEGGVEVELCSVTGSAGALLNGHVLYFNDNSLNVAQRAWDFMSQHTLPESPVVPILSLSGTAVLTTLFAAMGAAMARRLRGRD